MGWLTPLIPHLSGGRRGSRWRVSVHPSLHGEVMAATELGERAAVAMEREWFHPEQHLDVVFQQREWRVEALARRMARGERVQVLTRPIQVHAGPPVYWVATRQGRFRHAVRHATTKPVSYRVTVCNQGWAVHACDVTELQRLQPCPICVEALDGEERTEHLMGAT